MQKLLPASCGVSLFSLLVVGGSICSSVSSSVGTVVLRLVVVRTVAVSHTIAVLSSLVSVDIIIATRFAPSSVLGAIGIGITSRLRRALTLTTQLGTLTGALLSCTVSLLFLLLAELRTLRRRWDIRTTTVIARVTTATATVRGRGRAARRTVEPPAGRGGVLCKLDRDLMAAESHTVHIAESSISVARIFVLDEGVGGSGGRLESGDVAANQGSHALKLVGQVLGSHVGREAGNEEGGGRSTFSSSSASASTTGASVIAIVAVVAAVVASSRHGGPRSSFEGVFAEVRVEVLYER